MDYDKYRIELEEHELQEVFRVLSYEREKEESVYKFKVALRNECIVKLMYYAALKTKDIIELKSDDLDLEKGVIKVRGEGLQYELRIVDSNLRNILKLHKRANEPQEYFFENISRGNKPKLSERMIQNVLKKVFIKAKIENYYNIFGLRIRCSKISELKRKYKFTTAQVFYWVGYQSETDQKEVEELYKKICS